MTNNVYNIRPTAAPSENDEPESPVTGRDGTNQPTGVRTDVE
jgi:hypothetical protein